MDPILLELTPGPTLPLAQAARQARVAVSGAATDLLSASDALLERPWPWRGEEADIRYGLYYPLELIEAAEGEAHRILESAERQRTLAGPAPAAVRIAPATAARWDLQGLLVGLDEGVLDTDPGGSEWTVRQTLGHIVNSQRAYAWFTGWWLSQRGADPFPTQRPGGPRRPGARRARVGDGRLPGRHPGAVRRGPRRGRQPPRIARRRGPRGSRALVRYRGRRRVPARSLELPHPGAHDPGREDPGP